MFLAVAGTKVCLSIKCEHICTTYLTKSVVVIVQNEASILESSDAAFGRLFHDLRRSEGGGHYNKGSEVIFRFYEVV